MRAGIGEGGTGWGGVGGWGRTSTPTGTVSAAARSAESAADAPRSCLHQSRPDADVRRVGASGESNFRKGNFVLRKSNLLFRQGSTIQHSGKQSVVILV